MRTKEPEAQMWEGGDQREEWDRTISRVLVPQLYLADSK